MAKLSIIIPFCNEYPQIFFTVCGIRCELEDSDIDWEIITIANKNTDKGYKRLCDIAKYHKRIKSLKFDDKLSHWNAKNFGIENSTGDVLLFVDGHCLVSKNSIINMYNYFIEHMEELNGTLHLPILYMNEVRGKPLEYKLRANMTTIKALNGNDKNTPHNMHYVFTPIRNKEVHRVPCMSTCGMMISRDILVNKLGMWPKAMGIYGGGENFINFTLAVMGYHINVFKYPNAVHHYAEKRKYGWNYDNWIKNRIIASYVSCGKEWSKIFALNARGKKRILERMLNETIEECYDHRQFVKKFIKMTPIEWIEKEEEAGRLKEAYK